MSAAAAVSAIRAAERNIFLSTEGDASAAARAGLHEYLGLVEEFHADPLRPNVGFG